MRNKAQSIVEYALLLSVVIAGLVAAIATIGNKTRDMVDRSGQVIEEQTSKFLQAASGN
jgi:Flp pilus assembly pilin Flp